MSGSDQGDAEPAFPESPSRLHSRRTTAQGDPEPVAGSAGGLGRQELESASGSGRRRSAMAVPTANDGTPLSTAYADPPPYTPTRRSVTTRLRSDTEPEYMRYGTGQDERPIVRHGRATSDTSALRSPVEEDDLSTPHLRSTRRRRRRRAREDGIALPSWQPDSEVLECPVCSKKFGLITRKHHCRKCGRVVCASCSPHRITIPLEFVVRPPQNMDQTSLLSRATPSEGDTLSPSGRREDIFFGGGEEVRVCNPCVPDPNYSLPPQSDQPDHQRHVGNRRSSLDDLIGLQEALSGSTLPFPSAPRLPLNYNSASVSRIPAINTPNMNRLATNLALRYGSQDPNSNIPHSWASYSINSERLTTIQSSRVPRAQIRSPPPPPTQEELLQGRCYRYRATEKDSEPADDEEGRVPECSICLEEFETGAQMARLPCWCRFHEDCIAQWWRREGSRLECPMHKLNT